MKHRMWVIPVQGGEDVMAEVNEFTAKHRVLRMERQFVADGGNSFWTIWVLYTEKGVGLSAQSKRDGAGRVDYREVLSPEEFRLFVRVRDLRKQVAAGEGIPVYNVFTNEQMAEMARRKTSSLTALGEISGVGAARVEKYGQAFIDEIAKVVGNGA